MLNMLQSGYMPYVFTLVVMIIGILYLLAKKQSLQVADLTKSNKYNLIAVLGFVTGITFRLSAIQGISAGRIEEDGLPGIGPHFLMMALFILFHAYMLLTTKFTPEKHQGHEPLIKAAKTTILLLIGLIVFAIIEQFIPYY